MNQNLELGGVLVASLIGSWHCAGMCGPFSSFMSARNDMKTTQGFYHIGRLFTYLSMTTILFLLAVPVKTLVGPWLIYGILILWLVAGIFGKSLFKWQIPKPLVRLNQKMQKLSGPLAGFSLGSITTLLPCVWLYGFVGLALTKPSLQQAWLLILVFWAGTVPALLATQYFVLKSNTLIKRHSRKLSLALMVALSLFSLWMHQPQATEAASCHMHESHH